MPRKPWEMENIDNNRFEILRRNSLKHEVDGSFDELEDLEELAGQPKRNITHQECLLLHRVLADKAKLPISCRTSPTSEETVAVRTEQTAVTAAEGDITIGGLVRRLTGAASEALNLVSVKRDLNVSGLDRAGWTGHGTGVSNSGRPPHAKHWRTLPAAGGVSENAQGRGSSKGFCAVREGERRHVRPERGVDENRGESGLPPDWLLIEMSSPCVATWVKTYTVQLLVRS